MKLSKLEIANFRCFESLIVELQPDVNVIVGSNGAGKTSILDAIAIALYELVAANGGGGKRQRAQQRAALQATDIRVEPEVSDTLQGRRDFVHFRATATDFYPVEGFPATTPSGQPAAASCASSKSRAASRARRLLQLRATRFSTLSTSPMISFGSSSISW